MQFLIYLILILAAAAIWQIVRVVELSNDLKGENPNKVKESDNRMNGVFMISFVTIFFIWTIWQLFEYGERTLPVSASEQGQRIDELMNFNWWIVISVFFLTNAVLFYFAYKYYGRDNNRATYYAHNNRLEMLWTGIPAVVLAVIIFWGITLWNDITDESPSKAVRVEVYSKQFNWVARYAGVDSTLGKASYRFISGTNELGLDTTDVKGQDDVIVTELHMPVGEEIDIRFRSQDVIHSAFLPHFRMQMNTVPGMLTGMHFKPTITTDSMRRRPEVIAHIAEVNEIRKQKGEEPIVFDYWLLCNKICGPSHWNMKMKIVVESREQFDKWIAGQKTFGTAAPAVKTGGGGTDNVQPQDSVGATTAPVKSPMGNSGNPDQGGGGPTK